MKMNPNSSIGKMIALSIVVLVSSVNMARAQDIIPIYDGGEGERDRERLRQICAETDEVVRQANETIARIKREQQEAERIEREAARRRQEAEELKEATRNVLIVVGVLGVLYMIAKNVR